MVFVGRTIDAILAPHIYPSPEGLSVYFREFTERKHGEQALRDAKEQAENLI